MMDLANRLKADPWVCMPHLADDEYVREFAKLVKARLDPSLKVVVEFSNEVWNGMFEQARWAERLAKERGIGPSERPWEGRAQLFARRSVEIFRIWEEVFGGRERLVRALAWQAAGGSYWSDGMLLAQTRGAADVDALAIAPYVSMNVPERSDEADALTADKVAAWTVEQVLDHVEQKALPECMGWIREQKAVADKYGVRLVCYEAGQHLVGVGGGENNEALAKLLHAANRHPRMGGVYEKYLAGWKDAGGDLIALFSSIGTWSKWGSWGLGEYYDSRPEEYPKWAATRAWARAQGQRVGTPGK